MAEHLTALDATFLELEESDESAHMHIGGALVFEPPPGGARPSLETLREQTQARLPALPPSFRRLSEPHTGGLDWPRWELDPDFRIDHHVHRAALPAPGGEAELNEWLAEYWSHRLDRRRPLWDVVLLEGLEGGRWAMVTKTHHSMVDGVGSMDVGHVMLDAEPDPPPREPLERPAADDAPGDPGLVWRLPAALAGAIREGADIVLHPDRLRDVLHRSRALAELLVRDELIAAPSSSLNVPIGTQRSFRIVTLPLEDVKAIKSALGGTVNDVVLTVVTTALRRVLLARAEEPPRQGLRAMVPMNIRTAGEHLALGNKITSLFVHLPVAEATMKGRYEAILRGAGDVKAGSQATGSDTLIHAAAHLPPVLHSSVARSLFASRLFNVTVTNVPGPQTPFYSMGARMLDVHGLVPLAAEHAVGVAILSYAGRMSFGVVSDRDTMPDIDVLADGIRDALEELAELARDAAKHPAATA